MNPRLACGANASNRDENTASPRALNRPAPSRSWASPVGNRASPSSDRLTRGVSRTLSLARTATSPRPKADPLTSRDVSGSAFGLGDVAVRAKLNVRETPRVSLSLLGDARFPTGDAQDLL